MMILSPNFHNCDYIILNILRFLLTILHYLHGPSEIIPVKGEIIGEAEEEVRCRRGSKKI